jgi:hypothetical protein
VSRNPVKSAALDWPEGELPSGEDSLWARFDYLKLRETLEAIVSAMEATTKASSEPEADLMLRLVVSNDEPEKGEGSPRDGAAENERESLD